MINQALSDIFDPEILSATVGRLEARDVHVWLINRVECRDRDNYSEYFLSEDEQYRAQRFRFSRDRDRFVMGRYLTRVLLAHYTDSTPDKVRIESDAYGKPFSDLKLNFNISHSHELLLLGFSESVIGVDIEKKDASIDIESLSKSHFSELDFQVMMNEAEGESREKFFEIWTKKESLVKGIGKGLSISLQDFSVMGEDGNVEWVLPGGQTYGDWYVREFEARMGYKSAFATQNQPINLSSFRLDI